MRGTVAATARPQAQTRIRTTQYRKTDPAASVGDGANRPMLTVLFATRNGMGTLKSVLTAYSRLQPPVGGWKLIVVDNASTDSTAEIVKSFGGSLPLQYLYESTPGKNAALNAGLPHIEGDLVLLTDDDVLPRPDWLVVMRSAADRHPEFSIFAGAVLPRWEVPPPTWVLKWVPLGPVFTLSSPMADGPTIPDSVYGPNMAVRAQIFGQGLRFDPSIGPRGSSYAMGSETEFVARLARAGHRCWHVADAEVEHFIREYQLEQRWIFGRAIRFGRGHYRLTYREQPSHASTLRGVPVDLLKEMVVQSLLFVKAVASLDRESAFRARWSFNLLRGSAIEARARHRESALLDMRPREA